jgi:hypothetical protein
MLAIKAPDAQPIRKTAEAPGLMPAIVRDVAERLEA